MADGDPGGDAGSALMVAEPQVRHAAVGENLGHILTISVI
jgi:hypothetical protein